MSASASPPRIHWGALCIGLVFGLLGVLGLIGSWGAYGRDTDIVRAGHTAQATVLHKHRSQAGDDDTEYVVAYRFALPDGRSVDGQHSLPRERWAPLQKGDALTVHYAPDQPRRNFPQGRGVTSMGVTVFVSVLAAVFAVFGGLLVFGALRPRSAAID